MAGHALSAVEDVRPAVEVDSNVSQTPSVFTAFVTRGQDGVYELLLTVGGIHCAGCIARIEEAMHALPGMKMARLNFSTQRLHLRWNGAPDTAGRAAEALKKLGYDAAPFDARAATGQAQAESRFLLMCLGVAGFAAGNIMLLSLALWITTAETMGQGTRELFHWISALIATPAIAYSGRPFFLSAFSALRAGRTNMDVPISVGLILTTGMSYFEFFTGGEHVYFDSAVMLMFFLLTGRYLDFRARASARRAASDLLGLLPAAAKIISDSRVNVIKASDLREGMMMLVAAGERVAADGTVITGNSALDLSLVTGETMPVPVSAGTAICSGSLNLSAPLTVRVERTAENSFLADIVRLMEKAEQGQAKYVRIADRAARLYTPVVHILAALTFAGWLFFTDIAWQDALLIAATVLIITCPCALGLAVPVVQILAVGQLMKKGILVKSGDALERMAAIDTVVFDKTGTLTLGRPCLENANEIDAESFEMAASLAACSTHPLSSALVAAWGGDIRDVGKVQEEPGKGLEARWQGRLVRLGSRGWCGGDADSAAALELWLRMEGGEPVCFRFSDALRPDAASVVAFLKAQGIDVHLMSGDRIKAVESVAQELGIDRFKGAMTPQMKYEALENLRAQGRKILMAGDGLNDAPVLAAAHVSLSPASAADIAQNAADMLFTGDSLWAVAQAWQTARLSQSLVKENFVLSIIYNIVAVPVAMAGYITPLLAAVAMSLSSLAVILNSFRLYRQKQVKN